MTASELAEHVARAGGRSVLQHAVGCSKATLSAWLRGKRPIGADWAKRIRAAPDGKVARRGPSKDAQAMTLAEVRGHRARFGEQKAFCRAVGCCKSTAYRWLKGLQPVHARWLERIRAAVDVPPRPCGPMVDPRQLTLPLVTLAAVPA